MNWQKLHQHFDQAFDFFGRISVSDSLGQTGVSVYPLIKLSTGLALKTMDNPESNRLVILFPTRLQIAQWIATFSALEVMRKDYHENPTGKLKFSRKQKLLVNNRVVEFDRIEYFLEQREWKLWVKCSDGKWAIPLNRQLDFQPVRTKRRLSTLQSVRQAYYSSSATEVAIDAILDIHTKGNHSLFDQSIILVSKIGKTSDFIQEYYLNNCRIIDVFQWGKLDVSGDVTVLTSGQCAAEPSCLIAGDLFSAAEYIINNSQRTRGVIVDGVASCLRDTQRLDDDLLSRNIPVIVIADLFDTDSLSHLEEREFKIWQWNKDNLSHSKSITKASKESPFSTLNRSLTNYYCQQFIRELCEHSQLTKVVKDSLRLQKTANLSEDSQLQRLYCQLVSSINELSRLIYLPDSAWIANFRQRTQHIQEDFDIQRLWLRRETAQIIEQTLNNLKKLEQDPFPGINHKVGRLRHLIDVLLPTDVVAVVVPTANDAVLAAQFWRTEMSAHCINQLHFLAASDLQDTADNVTLTQVIICGWLNHKRMYPLLHLNAAPKITMLLYPYEAGWFKSAQARWKKQNNRRIRGRDFSGILKLPKNKLDFADSVPQEISFPPEDTDFDIIDFELKIRSYRYSRFTATQGSEDEIVKARTVVFTQNKFAFITETHRLLVVTDLMRGKASKRKIPRKDINQLKIGDYVLFREADRDIIREIADSALAEQNLSHLRQIAGLWREALRAKYQEVRRDLDELVFLLQKAGCKRKQSTIRNWLFDEDQIGPADRKDLERIARVTNNRELQERLEETTDAIKVVRGAHLQAAYYITRKLLTSLPEIFYEQQGIDDAPRRSVILDLDDFGQVMILRVEEIGDGWKDYETKWVNRLLTREDD
jgi:hypothetical protein